MMMILRKMGKNKWLELSLLLGIVISVALVSSMPVYTESILTRMLIKDMERYQTHSLVYPGTHYTAITRSWEPEAQTAEKSAAFEQFMKQQATTSFGIPVQQLVEEYESISFSMTPADGTKEDTSIRRAANLVSSSGLMEHISLIDGRLPAKEPVDGIYEVIVTEQALKLMRTVIGTVFDLHSDTAKKPIKLKPVGVFTKKQDNDLYFREPTLGNFSLSLVMDDTLFKRDFVEQEFLSVIRQHWFFVLDYSKLKMHSLEKFLQTSADIQAHARSLSSGYLVEVDSPMIDILEAYPERAKNLRTLMWSLNIPVLIMLGIYMYMVSNLISDRQKNEIAVLRSRGASRTQIMLSYMVEGLLLCGAALAVGPFAGLWLTKLLGASNGFLEFVNRASLPVQLTSETYRYAGIAALCSWIMMLIPVFLATRVSIVGHKQSMARVVKTPIWHKLYLDVIAIGVALYGLRSFQDRMKTLRSFGIGQDILEIDPLQFVVPAVFMIGVGLLLLRLYPYMLRLIYWIGRKWWPPSLYSTLIQLGRSSSQYQFLMVFLIMTVAMGVFSASAARTINNNTEDRIRYGNGADLILDVPWINDAPSDSGEGPNGAVVSMQSAPERIHYQEPPYEPYATLPGVEHAARVFSKKNVYATAANKQAGSITIVGIKTDEFGLTSWFRDGLLGRPFYEYLNLIAGNPRAILISRSVAEQMQVKEGDSLWIGWGGVDEQPFVVYGVIEYFPSFNPQPASFDSEAKNNKPMLVVGHLRHIQTHLALEPYSIWLKLKPGATAQEVYQGITDRKLKVSQVTNTADDLIQAKNDPFLKAINGVMTLGFLVSIVVSFTGFLLYWIITLSGRSLQTGILRAIGMRFSQLIGMLTVEQVLTSGAAVLIGVVSGNITSRLFVPMFESAFDPSKLVPPFRVMFDAEDSIRLYAMVLFMILLGLGILGWMLSRIKIHQALKLGED